jgi:hypothetical protein
MENKTQLVEVLQIKDTDSKTVSNEVYSPKETSEDFPRIYRLEYRLGGQWLRESSPLDKLELIA